MNDVVDVPAPASRPATTFVLRRTPATRSPWQALVLLLGAWAPSIGLPLGFHWLIGTFSATTALAIASVAVVTALAWLAYTFVLPRQATIVVDDDALDIPLGRSRLRVMLDELATLRDVGGALVVFALPERGQPARGHVGAVVVGARFFTVGAGAHTIVADVAERLGRRRDGAARLQQLAATARQQAGLAAVRPVVVRAAVVACVALYLAETRADGPLAAALIESGANIPSAVLGGELWRLVSSNLLHGSAVHLAMNMMGLLSAGVVIERWLGRQKMLLLLVVSGTCGQLVSAVWATMQGTDRFSVGISGAVFGLIGLLFSSTLRFRKTMRGGLVVPLSGWMLLLVNNVTISTIPVVDVAAHVGGFIAGALVALVLMPKPGVAHRVSKRVVMASRLVLVVVVAAVVRWAVAMAAV